LVLRHLNIPFSLFIAMAMTVTSFPQARAAPASNLAAGASTLCDGAGCVSVLDSFGAKTHKAAHARPGKRPAYKPGKPNRPGANKPGKPHSGQHHRPPNWHHRPIHDRPYYRPWRARDWYGAMFAGVILGTIIAVAANTPPPPPSPELCWYWSNNARTQGYWDYCY